LLSRWRRRERSGILMRKGFLFGGWRMEDGLRARDEATLDLFVLTVEGRVRKIK
jgi:hypothetical protein